MTRRLLLAGSIGLNLLLAMVAWKQGRLPFSNGAGAQPGLASAPVVPDLHSTPSAPANRTGVAEVRPSAVEDFRWSELNTASWAAYRDGLRAIGCPPGTIRDILEPLIGRSYLARVDALVGPGRNRFWERMASPSVLLEPLQRAVSELSEEKSALLQDLFRDLPQSATPPSKENEKSEAQISFLADSLRPPVADALRRFRTRVADIYRSTGGGSEQAQSELQQAEVECKQELAGLLSPGELAELNRRRSRSAHVRDLEGIELTEAEIATILRIRDQRVPGQPTPNAPTESQIQQELASALGPARLAELLRAEDQEFQALGHLASVLELPPEVPVALWEAQQSALAKVKDVEDNASLGLSEQRRRVAEVQARLEQEAAKLLGPQRNFDTWQRSRRDWLREHFNVPDPDPVEMLR